MGTALAETMVSRNMAQMLKDIDGISAEHLDYGGQGFPFFLIPDMHFF